MKPLCGVHHLGSLRRDVLAVSTLPYAASRGGAASDSKKATFSLQDLADHQNGVKPDGLNLVGELLRLLQFDVSRVNATLHRLLIKYFIPTAILLHSTFFYIIGCCYHA